MDNLEEIKKQISDLQSKADKLENENKKEIKRWRANRSDTYYYVDDCGHVNVCYENNDGFDNYRYKMRNYFRTAGKATEYKEIINTYYDLMDLAEELNNGEKIDWNDNQQCKYTIFYDFEDNFLKRTNAYVCKEFGQIYCLDGDFVEKAIEKIGEDRLKKLFKYERS